MLFVCFYTEVDFDWSDVLDLCLCSEEKLFITLGPSMYDNYQDLFTVLVFETIFNGIFLCHSL